MDMNPNLARGSVVAMRASLTGAASGPAPAALGSADFEGRPHDASTHQTLQRRGLRPAEGKYIMNRTERTRRDAVMAAAIKNGTIASTNRALYEDMWRRFPTETEAALLGDGEVAVTGLDEAGDLAAGMSLLTSGERAAIAVRRGA
jgi:hypothetical protein